MTDVPPLESYPSRSFDKLRYGDTDRQGHVNNAVFVTMLETGRVEALLRPELRIADEGTEFVIARVELDYLAEVRWPGQVDIGSRVSRIGTSSLTFEQGVFQDGVPVAHAQTVIVQMDDETRRSRAFSDGALARLSTLFSDETPPATSAEA